SRISAAQRPTPDLRSSNRRAVEKLHQPLTSPIDPGLDRLDGDAQEVGGLLLGQIVEIGQEQRLLELARQLIDGLLKDGPTFDRDQIGFAVGLWIRMGERL